MDMAIVSSIVAIFIAFSTIILIAGFISYIINGIAFMKLGKKAGMENSWISFIPLGIPLIKIKISKISVKRFLIYIIASLATLVITSIAATSESTALILLVGLLNLAVSLFGVILLITIEVRILKAFGKSPWLLLLTFVPFGMQILYIVLGLGSAEYQGLEEDNYIYNESY